MPAKSKQQQKFMGIVRAIQKGDEPASKFSKDAQDAADDMKKKDVEKFASTKHKGLPKKVEQYLRQQIRKSVEEIIEEDWFKRLSSNDQKKYLKDHPNSKKAKQVKANKSKVKNTLLKGLKSGGLSVYSYGSMINQALDQIGDYPDLKKKIDTYGNNVPSSKGKSEAQYQKEIDKYNAEGEKIKKDIAKTLKKEVKEDYVETCGYTQSADGKKLKTPGATGEEDRHLKEKNESMNPSAIKKMRDEFEKTGDLPPHLKKFALDLKILKKKHKVKNIVVPGLEWMSDMKEQSVNEKKKMFPPKKMTPKQAKEYKKFIGYAKMGVEYQIDMSLFESINEARLDPKQLLQQLGGNRFIMMVGAKNLAIDKPKNELHMKIGRNAKGVSHVRIRLSSMDLYDMEFLQVRAGKIKIKSKEKGVYADQLGKMFKKNTGMNVRL